MNQQDKEWKEEQLRIDEVLQEFGKKEWFFEMFVGGLKYDIIGLRKSFWEDVMVNFDDVYEVVEMMVSIKQQVELLFDWEWNYWCMDQQFK